MNLSILNTLISRNVLNRVKKAGAASRFRLATMLLSRNTKHWHLKGLVFATGHQRPRARICDWTSKTQHNSDLMQTSCSNAGVRCGMFHDPVSLSGASDIKQLRQGVRCALNNWKIQTRRLACQLKTPISWTDHCARPCRRRGWARLVGLSCNLLHHLNQSIGEGHGKCGEPNDHQRVQPETHTDWTCPSTTQQRLHCFHTTKWRVWAVVPCAVMWCNVVPCGVMSGDVRRCHVMWCAVLMYCGSWMQCAVAYCVWCVLYVCCIVLYLQ